MIVRVSAWSDRTQPMIREAVRRALANLADPTMPNGVRQGQHLPMRLVSVAPLPADRIIKPRKPRERRGVPELLAAMGVEK